MINSTQNRGFTFVELLLSVMILAGAIGGALLLFTSSMISSENAWDTTVAVSHGEHVLEDMQSRNSLEDILSVNWQDWVIEQKILTLPNEVINVSFDGAGSNLLDINVEVLWTRKSRNNQISLNTKMTK